MSDFVSQGTHERLCKFPKLEEVLKGHVESKKVLLILDDVWDDMDDCRWKKLLAPFKSANAKGNMILVTTRRQSVAKRRGTAEPIRLSGLKNDDFWLLFKSCAFGDENYEEQFSLHDLGQQIAERLKGNPLAAETAGALLREDLTIDHWSNILKNEDWKSLQLSSGIMPALKLCYDQLPYHLQQCFSYCSIFPYGHHFLVEELVNMWISQGFVKCNDSNKRLEEIGRHYLTDLVNLGFFEQVKKTQLSSSSTQTYYAMCGLMHGMAAVVSKTERAAMDGLQNNEILPSVHHLSIIRDSAYRRDGQTWNISGGEKFEEKLRSTVPLVTKLRTLVLIGQYESSFFKALEEVLRKAHNLRLLQISATPAYFHSFLCSLVNPTHLRYLKLDGHVEQRASAQILPQVHLYNDSAVQENATWLALQKVRLENCVERQAVLSLERLPFLTTLKLANMWGVREVSVPSLEELALVNMPDLERCSCTPVGRLNSSLRVLEIRKCSALNLFDLFEKAHNSEIGHKPLQLSQSPSLHSLQLHSCTSLEDLRIEECGRITTIEGLHLEKLRHLNVCKNLRLSRIFGTGYQLSPRLEYVIICELSLLTTSLFTSLNYLQDLIVQHLKIKAKRLTDEQERALMLHRSLQKLIFEDCEYLVHLPAGLHSVPSLKRLEIIYCGGISRLPEEGLPPSLKELVIYDCSKELSDQCRLLATSKLMVKIDEH